MFSFSNNPSGTRYKYFITDNYPSQNCISFSYAISEYAVTTVGADY